MKRLGASLAFLVALGCSSVSPAATAFRPPAWLLHAQQALLDRSFGHAKAVRVHYIEYPKKIAVVFEFDRVVICGMCSSPTASSQPRGKVLRVSFDRRTHRLGGAPDGWAIRFCEVRGDTPPLRVCLRR